MKRKVWLCSARYKEKGVKGCESKHIDEEVLKKAFVEVFNVLIDNRDYFLEKWKHDFENADTLNRYRLNEFIGILKDAKKRDEFDNILCLKMLEKVTLLNDQEGLIFTLLDGTNIECKDF